MSTLVQKPAKAIIFARLSITECKRHENTLEAQVIRAREYCKRNNLEIIYEFLFISGSSSQNYKYRNTIIDFTQKQNEMIALVCDAPDRLKNAFFYLQHWATFYNFSIHYCNERLIVDNANMIEKQNKLDALISASLAYTNVCSHDKKL